MQSIYWTLPREISQVWGKLFETYMENFLEDKVEATKQTNKQKTLGY